LAKSPERKGRRSSVKAELFGDLAGRSAGHQPTALGDGSEGDLLQGHPNQGAQLPAQGPAGSRDHNRRTVMGTGDRCGHGRLVQSHSPGAVAVADAADSGETVDRHARDADGAPQADRGQTGLPVG
jgi:hypothetical protein